MTTYREFEFENDEWVFSDGTIITADLTLVLSADPCRDIVAGIRLEAVRNPNQSLERIIAGRWLEAKAPLWLADAMTAWVRDNQPALEVVRREHFAEAAE